MLENTLHLSMLNWEREFLEQGNSALRARVAVLENELLACQEEKALLSGLATEIRAGLADVNKDVSVMESRLLQKHHAGDLLAGKRYEKARALATKLLTTSRKVMDLNILLSSNDRGLRGVTKNIVLSYLSTIR